MPMPPAGIRPTPRLVGRVVSILRSPRAEGAVIADEPATPMEIYTGYAAPLAAIGALALVVAQVAYGLQFPLIGVVKADVVTGLAAGLLMFAAALVNLFVLAWIIDGLAPRFGGQADPLQALKVAAYSYTPIWLAGLIYLVPALSVLWGVAAIYALYLAYIGLPVVMKCRPDRAASYALIAGAASFMVFAIFAGVTNALVGFGPGLFD